MNGSKVLRRVTLTGGIATLMTSTLAVGTHPITAKYLGDASNDKSQSVVINHVVQ
jgi:hypothetical protein